VFQHFWSWTGVAQQACRGRLSRDDGGRRYNGLSATDPSSARVGRFYLCTLLELIWQSGLSRGISEICARAYNRTEMVTVTKFVDAGASEAASVLALRFRATGPGFKPTIGSPRHVSGNPREMVFAHFRQTRPAILTVK